MRKQTKVAAIVSAAALLVIGASMTSMASVKGTWMMVDGEWMCYDSNGDPYTDVFASSNGKDFYLGDDGYLVRSDWVEYDGDMYFVNSSGQKITNDWRLTVPYEDDENEEEWFYFQSTGKRAENKKISYKGNTYYFDSDGIMLTGWVSSSGSDAVNEASGFDKDDTYYCDENGARLSNAWVYDVEPGTDDDDADADEYWYFIKGSGKPATGKRNNVKGQTYLFDSEGRMLYGWVAESGDYDADTKKWDYSYYRLDEEDEEIWIKDALADGVTGIYYCGEEDDGHAKKNKWVYLCDPGDADQEDEYWYWFDKNGKVYFADKDGYWENRPNTETASNTVYPAVKMKFEEGQVFTDKDGQYVTSKKVNSKTYWFNDEAEMVHDFYMIDMGVENGVGYELFYFGGGSDGAMKTGSQSVKDDCDDTYKFYFYTKQTDYTEKDDDGEVTSKVTYSKGAGVTGNKSNKLYYYGMLIQADDYKYQIATISDQSGKEHSFVVNTSGSIQHSSSDYKEDGDVIISVDKTNGYKYDTSSSQWKYQIEYGVESTVTDVNIDSFVIVP